MVKRIGRILCILPNSLFLPTLDDFAGHTGVDVELHTFVGVGVEIRPILAEDIGQGLDRENAVEKSFDSSH